MFSRRFQCCFPCIFFISVTSFYGALVAVAVKMLHIELFYILEYGFKNHNKNTLENRISKSAVRFFPCSNQSSLMKNSLFIIFQNSAFHSTETTSLFRGPMTEKVIFRVYPKVPVILHQEKYLSQCKFGSPITYTVPKTNHRTVKLFQSVKKKS